MFTPLMGCGSPVCHVAVQQFLQLVGCPRHDQWSPMESVVTTVMVGFVSRHDDMGMHPSTTQKHSVTNLQSV